MQQPIQINTIRFSVRRKLCFEDFSASVAYSSRIAIIGRNGSGKSSLLNMLRGVLEPNSGEISMPDESRIGYVPQVVEQFDTLSGGQRFHKALTRALSLEPDVLLLDEPTNHLDQRHRQSLMRMLNAYTGTLIIVSHDGELLRQCVDILWHIDQGRIHVVSGGYDHYRREIQQQRAAMESALQYLERQKKGMHKALMKEQGRAAKSRAKGEKSISQRKWPTVVSKAKANRASETAGRKKLQISQKKQDVHDQMAQLYLPDIIVPSFALTAAELGDATLVSISDGSVGYADQLTVINGIHLSVATGDRIAILGDNASGKSTLIRAMMNDACVRKTGYWQLPKPEDIGYLDQHYRTLSAEQSVLETIHAIVPDWSVAEVRRHLNDFLFKNNEEVNMLVESLSGGEKARLSMAQIAAATPKLLILDEITNNLDLETCQHVIEVLSAYPGAMIVISHDNDFLKAIHVTQIFKVENAKIVGCDFGSRLA